MKLDQKYILVINAGSSSLKFKVFELESLKVLEQGIVERIGLPGAFIRIGDSRKKCKAKDHSQAFLTMIDNIKEYGQGIVAVGHRVVHGGEDLTEPVIVSGSVIKTIKKYSKLAPLHNPVNLAGILASKKYLRGAKDIAVFDTSFYKTIPDYAYLYPIPLSYYKKHGIRRYGFHGISHAYVAGQAAKKIRKPLAKLNLITCHLGSGCSITAIKGGKAIDTSMGFTPLEGVMMSTRSGSIDPSIPLFLIRELRMKPEQVDQLLNKESGLKALGGSMDMREILSAAGYSVPGFKLNKKVTQAQKHIAQLTVNMFVYTIKRYIGAYTNVLGSVHVIVFTAGIGERSSKIRSMIMSGNKTQALVIPTNEELRIAEETKHMLR